MTLLAEASFDVAALIFGGLLMVGALASGIAHRSFLSLTAVFVLAGFAFGDGGLGILEIDPRSGFVHDLATVALIVILFRDGLEVEAEMLQTAWRLPARKLVVAMPLTCLIVAVATHWLTGLGWTESFLVGALLSPTDPVLSSSVVTNPRVPRVVRHSLNLEFGLNDGLALPAVLAFSAALSGERGLRVVAVRAPGRDPRLRLRRASRAAGRGADPAQGWDSRAPALAVRPRRGVRHLRHHGPAAGGQRADRRVRVCHHARDPPSRLARTFEERSDDIVEIVKLGVSSCSDPC